MIARQSVWNDPKIVELANQFVPAADEVWRLQHGQDAEAKLFQGIMELGHYGGRFQPTDTRQGTYVLTAGGEFLGSINSNDPRAMERMLRSALERHQAVDASKKRIADRKTVTEITAARGEGLYPEDGLALRVVSRDLPREGGASDWRANAWNIDYTWFTRAEAGRFVPELRRVGQKVAVPKDLVSRLARAAFVDNVRGQTSAFSERDVQVAELTSEISEIRGDRVVLRLRGNTVTSTSGTWSIRGYADMDNPSQQNRGMDLNLLGLAHFNVKTGRFERVELIAAGQRWGATQYNGRHDDLGPHPIAFMLTVAGDSAAERVAPAHLGVYASALR